MIRDFRFFRNLELKKKKKKNWKSSTNSNARRKAKSSISLYKSIQKTGKKKKPKPSFKSCHLDILLKTTKDK